MLWKNKSVTNKIFSNMIQLESILFKELKKKELKIFFIYYQNELIFINVYNNLTKNKGLKYYIVKYFLSVLLVNKVIEEFNLSKKHVKWFIKNIKIQNFKNTKYSNSLLLLLNNYSLKILIKNLKLLKFLCFIANKMVWVLNSLIYFYKRIKLIKFKRKKNIKIYFKKIRKINGLIKYKLIANNIENIILNFFVCLFKIKINNILSNSGFVLKYKIKDLIKKKEFYFIFQTLILAFIYNNTRIISEYIASFILLTTNHLKDVKKFIKIFEKLYFSNIVKLTGFKLWLKGKLNGKMRKSKYIYKIGKVQLQTLKLIFDYNLYLSFTKFGIISIKTWLINDYY